MNLHPHLMMLFSFFPERPSAIDGNTVRATFMAPTVRYPDYLVKEHQSGPYHFAFCDKFVTCIRLRCDIPLLQLYMKTLPEFSREKVCGSIC
jgi:hypothetical protein